MPQTLLDKGTRCSLFVHITVESARSQFGCARARRRRFQRVVRPSCAEQNDRLEPALRLLVDVAISF